MKAAHDYIDHRLSPADLIARWPRFRRRCGSIRISPPIATAWPRRSTPTAAQKDQGFEAGATPDDDTADNGTAFTADDTEFNIFTTGLGVRVD